MSSPVAVVPTARLQEGYTMRPTFLQTLHDEALRAELGSKVVASLAVENLDLSSPNSSQAVRRAAIERRA